MAYGSGDAWLTARPPKLPRVGTAADGRRGGSASRFHGGRAHLKRIWRPGECTRIHLPPDACLLGTTTVRIRGPTEQILNFPRTSRHTAASRRACTRAISASKQPRDVSHTAEVHTHWCRVLDGPPNIAITWGHEPPVAIHCTSRGCRSGGHCSRALAGDVASAMLGQKCPARSRASSGTPHRVRASCCV